jgi:hypothetical protein
MLMSQDDKPKSPAPGFFQVVMSVAAAMFGVQSSRARQRDFTHGRPLHYIVVGVVMVGLFIGAILLVVHLLLKNAGL